MPSSNLFAIIYSLSPTLQTAANLEIELSPFLLGLAVTAAALFVFGCFILVALYKRNANK